MTSTSSSSSSTITIRATAEGGSMWRVEEKGYDAIMMFADRRPDGSVYLREADDAAEADGIAARHGVDPDDGDSWDVDMDALDEALRVYFDLPANAIVII